MELFDLEAEAYVLSGLLLNPGLIEEYDIHRDCFYRGAHQFIFLSMVDLLQSHESLDVLLVGARLKEMERLKEIGGYTALHELAEKAISAQSAPHYIEQIQELSRRRKWYTLGQTLVHASQNGGDSTELCQLAEEALRESLPSKSWQSLDACMRETLDEVEHAFKGSGGLGIEMGFRELDQRTGGFKAGELVIVAARPGMGKTSFASQLALTAAQKEKTVGVISLEMGTTELVRRYLSIEGENLTASNLAKGQMTDLGWQSLVEVAGELGPLPLYILDSSSVTLEGLRMKARALQQREGLDLLVIDYFQLLSLSKESHSRVQDFTKISSSLKVLARELQIPIIALSQLNRSCESRPDKRPLLSDLRESGSIEQDADIVLCLYRDEVYDKDSPDAGMAEWLIRKNRNGPIGDVIVRWDGSRTRFH